MLLCSRYFARDWGTQGGAPGASTQLPSEMDLPCVSQEIYSFFFLDLLKIFY